MDKRPTIAELEATLADPNVKVEILPNGEARAYKETDARITELEARLKETGKAFEGYALIEGMARKYAEAGGESGPEMQDYKNAEEIVDKAWKAFKGQFGEKSGCDHPFRVPGDMCLNCGEWDTDLAAIRVRLRKLDEQLVEANERAASSPDKDANQTITDLAMIVRQLLTKPLTEKRKAHAWDYLKRKGLEGSILRADDDATTAA